MDWLSGLLTSHSALQTVVVLSLICSVGLALGKWVLHLARFALVVFRWA